jgi:hypothetical protein
MRYLQLFEVDDNETETNTPVQAPKPAATKVYFHVTTKHRLNSIQRDGIEPNHNRRWKTGFGKTLGERGNIYLMSDFTAAVRWAQKQEWEHFNGKTPDKSPYIIVCLRENPKNLEPDPHPENGLYGHTWFQKQGSIAPEDIMKIIPLTRALIKQVISSSEAVVESSMAGLTSNYSLRKCLRALGEKGWQETQTPNMFQNPNYPEYSVDLDINDPTSDGPFTIYHHNKKIKTTRSLPFAQQMGLKDKLLDKPIPQPDHDESEWD